MRRVISGSFSLIGALHLSLEYLDQKKEKARMTAALTCNALGTRKLAPWLIGRQSSHTNFYVTEAVIGTAKQPLAFGAENIVDLKALGLTGAPTLRHGWSILS